MSQTEPVTENPEQEVETLRQNDWPAAQFTAAEALRLATRLREDRKELEQEELTRNRQVTRDVLKHALERFPDNAEFYNEQGRLYADWKKYDQAAEWFDKTIKKEPTADNQLRLEALIGAGSALRNLRRYDEAAEMIEQAVAASGEPASPELLLEQAWLSFYQKAYADALARFQQAFAQLPDNEKHQARVGLLASHRQLELLPGYDEEDTKQLVSGWLQAGVTREEVIKVFIDCSRSVLEHLNLYPAALNNAEHLLAIAKDNQQGLYYKIAALKWLRKYADAEKTYHEAPHDLQFNFDIWDEWANIYYEQKQFRQAYLHYSGEVLKEPNLTGAQRDLKEELKTNSGAREWTIVSLRKMRKLDDARVKINEALATVSNKLNFYGEQGSLYYALRDYDNAIKAFDRALKLHDYDTFALQWRAASLRKKKNFAEAERAIDEALKKVPYATGLWEERGWLVFDQGKLDEAVTWFDKAIELDPYLLNKQFAKIETLLRLNRSDEALEVFRKLEQQFPDDAEVAEQLCWFYIRAGRLELAEEQVGKVEQSSPNRVLGPNARGGYELARRNYPAAEAAFRKALEMVDYEPQYYVNLAFALVRQVKPIAESSLKENQRRSQLIDEAKSKCRDALRLDPFNAKAYGCLGVIAFKQDAFLDAEVYFLKSIELSPTEGSYIELASLYCQMARYDEARAKLQEALKLNPKDARAYIELGNIAVWKEDNNEAVRQCRQAVAVEPTNPETHRALAIALMRAEKYEEAESVVRNALLNLAVSKPWRLHLLLAQILIRAGDLANKDRKKKDLGLYEEALRYVNEAKQASAPNAQADIFFHAGIVQHRREDYALSHKSFAECLDLNKNRFDAERCGRILQETIKQQRRVFTLSQWFGVGLAVVCFAMLLWLWGSYFRGHQRTILVQPPANSNSAPAEPRIEYEYTVDSSLLNVMTPILLGLMTIGALLPNLTKLKLPGFEAEVSEPKPTELNISTGPRGEIGFGSSLPIIDPEPR
jgi:tetratricopeptide (TPR) repeat protein